jgi:putative hemolysin
MELLYTFFIIVILIGLNGIFVAAEFSTVSARKSRIFQLKQTGDQSASSLYSIIEDGTKLDNYVASCQVGITISSLVLGFVGQANLSPILAKYLDLLNIDTAISSETLSVVVVLTVLSIFQVLFGELIPKNLGMQFPEKYALALLQPIKFSSILFKPLIWIFNGSGNYIMKIFNLSSDNSHGHIHSAEEISMLIDDSALGGLIAQEGKALLKNTISFNDLEIRKIMIPRSKMLSSSINVTNIELLQNLSESQYSRIPIYRNSIDEIIGTVHLRDLIRKVYESEETTQLDEKIVHYVNYFPESMSAKAIFNMLQKERIQIAIILDEFGGTAGMVTLEDMLEELFGDLQDEFDPIENKFFPDDNVVFSGDTQIVYLNNNLDIKLPFYQFDTIGGLLIDEIGKIPSKEHIGEKISIASSIFEIIEIDGPKISKIIYHPPTIQEDK